MDFSYKENLSKHQSQTDAAKGFGGKFGVQKDKVDKVILIAYKIIYFFSTISCASVIMSTVYNMYMKKKRSTNDFLMFYVLIMLFISSNLALK